MTPIKGLATNLSYFFINTKYSSVWLNDKVKEAGRQN